MAAMVRSCADEFAAQQKRLRDLAVLFSRVSLLSVRVPRFLRDWQCSLWPA